MKLHPLLHRIITNASPTLPPSLASILQTPLSLAHKCPFTVCHHHPTCLPLSLYHLNILCRAYTLPLCLPNTYHNHSYGLHTTLWNCLSRSWQSTLNLVSHYSHQPRQCPNWSVMLKCLSDVCPSKASHLCLSQSHMCPKSIILTAYPGNPFWPRGGFCLPIFSTISSLDQEGCSKFCGRNICLKTSDPVPSSLCFNPQSCFVSPLCNLWWSDCVNPLPSLQLITIPKAFKSRTTKMWTLHVPLFSFVY